MKDSVGRLFTWVAPMWYDHTFGLVMDFCVFEI